MVDTPKDALGVYNNLLNVADRFLNINIEYLGHVLKDNRMSNAVISRKVLCEAYPESPAVSCLKSVAQTLHEQPSSNQLTGNVQFFWRNLLGEVNL